MNRLNLKPSHKAVKQYFDEMESITSFHLFSEGAVSPAFANLLRRSGRQLGLTLAEQYTMKRNDHRIRVDGAMLDSFKLVHGVWEAKDTDDDLVKEVKRKFERGYPRDNILFQAPDHAIIWQDNREVFNDDIRAPEALVEAVKTFVEYEPPAYEQWEHAVAEFKDKVPELAERLLELLRQERRSNKRFKRAFTNFADVCRVAINPNISENAVEEMLIQHLLTERIFRNVFNNPDFTKRNIIAREIEEVIEALTSSYFSRHEFLASLDRFYGAIEETADATIDYGEKQDFLNTVYENFFQGFSVKVADTHGIVYTPQPIVNFMVRSVDEILRSEFDRSLADDGVHVLDPFVGTGNFVTRVMREIKRTQLPDKYRDELHCNEVMLLPYYIASMNIEHAYYEATGEYEPFNGICFVDTFELAEPKTESLFTERNTERVQRQQDTPIFVVIGNPPYNAGQVNENDNNKNRRYETVDQRVSETYGKDSRAQLLRKLNDPYVKAIRWASDRIGEEGIVAFVTNNSFINEITFDGMRKHLAQDFDAVYVLDLGGNVRKNPKLSGTTHNVFGIQVGVSVNFFVRTKDHDPNQPVRIHYAATGEDWRKEQKYDYLDEAEDYSNVDWDEITPDAKHNWLNLEHVDQFEAFIPVGTKGVKNDRENDEGAVFQLFSLGVGTNRDEWVYGFDPEGLSMKVRELIENYNSEVARYSQKREVDVLDEFLNTDPRFVKWTDRLKKALQSGTICEFDSKRIRRSLYRPFTMRWLYFDHLLNQRRYLQSHIFPTSESENWLICIGGYGRKDFAVLMTNLLPDLNFYADPQQSFPLYTYDEDGSNRRENITDWALNEFREHYADDSIDKWAIFHYVYGLLHHPGYREKYEANLKRELPRIPFAPDFWAFANAGKRLAELHVNYEDQDEYPLTEIEDDDADFTYRVEKMKLSKDKTQLIYNDFLTLAGIPEKVFQYRLGNRSALEWIVDQYRVKTDKRSGIVHDPNDPDDPDFIVRLIKKIVTVSLETVDIVNSLPDEFE